MLAASVPLHQLYRPGAGSMHAYPVFRDLASGPDPQMAAPCRRASLVARPCAKHGAELMEALGGGWDGDVG